MTDEQRTDTVDPGLTAAGVRWDLGQIFADDGSAHVAAQAAVTFASALAQEFGGRVADLSASEVSRVLCRLDDLHCQVMSVRAYVRLRIAEDTTAQSARNLAAAVASPLRQITDVVRSIDRQLQRLGQDRRDSLLKASEVAAHRHLLERLWHETAHSLPDETEYGLTLRDGPVDAWKALHRRTLAELRIRSEAHERPCGVPDLLALTDAPDSTTRLQARAALRSGLVNAAPTLASAFDALVADRWEICRARGYAHPVQVANLSNDLDDVVVDQLGKTVEARYDLMRRWYRAKAQLLGLATLPRADTLAPIGTSRTFSFDEACAIVLNALDSAWPTGARVVRELIVERRIHAEPLPGKEGSNFCSPVAPNRKPLIMIDYHGRVSDVLALAHESGHAIHDVLASGQPARLSRPPAVLAETAAVFTEMMIIDYMLSNEADPSHRLTLLGEWMQMHVSSVFFQTLLAGFECDAYAAREPGLGAVKALTTEVLSELWTARHQEAFGDAVEVESESDPTWCLIPHFITGAFRTHAYVFAQLVALTLRSQLRALGPEHFADRFEQLLAAGNSASPMDLLASMAIDIRDPHWIDPGMDEIERTVREIEACAADQHSGDTE